MKNEKNLEVELEDVDVELSEEQKKRFEEDAQSRNRRESLIQALKEKKNDAEAMREVTKFYYSELCGVLAKINEYQEQENQELTYLLKYSKHRMERP